VEVRLLVDHFRDVERERGSLHVRFAYSVVHAAVAGAGDPCLTRLSASLCLSLERYLIRSQREKIRINVEVPLPHENPSPSSSSLR
jgi:hypothetical protein